MWRRVRQGISIQCHIILNKTILNKMIQDKLSYESTDTAVDSITKVLYKTATKCFTLKKHRIKKRKNKPHKNKKWLDKGCGNLKTMVMSAAKNLMRYPSDAIPYEF